MKPRARLARPMGEPGVLHFYSDLHCPYAYLAAHRLRKALARHRGNVRVAHKCLAIEYVDSKCTPKDVLDAETPDIVAAEPDLVYTGWNAPESQWPVTFWPAFEAVKCAERQGWRQAHELDWRIREAFFAHSRCVSMRHVLLDLAKGVPGLDHARFVDDFDSGACKREVLAESRHGWETLDMQVSPTFLLPDGAMEANPVAPHVHLSEGAPRRVEKVDPAPVGPEGALAHYVGLLEKAAGR